MLKRLLIIALPLAIAGAAGAGSAAPPRGEWVGTYSVGNASKVAVAVRFSGARGTVALGTGHADAQTLAVRTSGTRVRFTVPGRPVLAFDGRLKGGVVRGTVRQGSARGSFTLRRGSGAALFARGYFGAGDTRWAFVDDPYGPARADELSAGTLHGIYGTGPAFRLGSGWSTEAPAFASARVDAAGATVAGAAFARLRVRQYEVRFTSGNAVLSGTFTVPAGPGKHPAVAFVSGSGRTERAYLPDLQALLVDAGVAVLAYDKRGIAQSAGQYPGESPTSGTIDQLARDAQAAARWLAVQPDVDAARVGLAGHSQAGWIMPLAASREPAARFMVSFSGPAVTADENDTWQNLAGEGNTPPTMSVAAMEAEVLRQGPGGVDPVPWIRALRIPALWMYGGLDWIVPSSLSTKRIAPVAAEAGRDFTVQTFPNANHALVETQTGLTSEMVASDRFAPGMFPAVRAWLAAHGLSR
jgi:dienelactone hydrolase